MKCDCEHESGTLQPCGTSINWDITKIARGAKTQIWWPQEQRTFTVDLTLSRHGVLVAGEELPANSEQAEWTHTSSVQTLWHHVHIHACLTPPSTPHTHSHKCSYTAQRPWIETTHFHSPKVQGTLLFYIHSDNQAKSLQQRHFQKRPCIVYQWKETAIVKD